MLVTFLFVKLNRVRSRVGLREQNKKTLLDFLASLENLPNKPENYMVLDNLADEQETVVLTFWKSREQMNDFYRPDNEVLAGFVNGTKQFMEQPPQRSDYEVVKTMN